MPKSYLSFEVIALADATVQALPAQHADLDLHHIQATGVLGRGVKLQTLQQSVRFLCGDGGAETIVWIGAYAGREVEMAIADEEMRIANEELLPLLDRLSDRRPVASLLDELANMRAWREHLDDAMRTLT